MEQRIGTLPEDWNLVKRTFAIFNYSKPMDLPIKGK